MIRNIASLAFLTAMIVISSLGIYIYRDRYAAERQINELAQQNQQLETFVKRLGNERRVAEVLVTDQKTVNGVLQSTLFFVEYNRDGTTTLPPKQFTIDGKWAHIDAMVIKFENDFVKKGDPLRGHSIALFTKIYGDTQSPAQGFTIDTPGRIPDIYRGADPQASSYEQNLWNDFWKLYTDEDYRKKMGVRVANGQGVWGLFEPDKLYTITVEADGGVNIKAEPLKGIYREALKREIPPS